MLRPDGLGRHAADRLGRAEAGPLSSRSGQPAAAHASSQAASASAAGRSWMNGAARAIRTLLAVQHDLDVAAGGKPGGGLGHDDVAVGGGEDRKERGAAEERHRLAVRQPHLDDVEPTGRRGQVALRGGRGRSVPAAARCSRRPSGRSASRSAGTPRAPSAGCRAGRSRDAADVGEQRRLARAQRQPVTPDARLAERGDRGGGLVASADRGAGRHHQDVTLR